MIYVNPPPLKNINLYIVFAAKLMVFGEIIDEIGVK